MWLKVDFLVQCYFLCFAKDWEMIEKTLSVHLEKLDLTQYIPNLQCFTKELPTIPQCFLKTSDFAPPLVLLLSIDVGQSLGEDR